MRKFLISLLLLFITLFLFNCSDEGSQSNLPDNFQKDASVDTLSFDATEDTKDTFSKDTLGVDTTEDINADSIIITDTISEDISDIVQTGDTIEDIIGTEDIRTDSGFEDISDSGPGDIGLLQPVINELMIEPNFSDKELGQYIEIYNPNNFGIDINGYKLRTDEKEFIISNFECDTVIMANSYLVIGATKDPTKNSYAKVKCEWGDRFTLTGAKFLELIRSDNFMVERINLTSISIKKGSALERSGNDFNPSPSLITFLDDTGLYKGDRGSPAKANYNLISRGELLESNTVSDRIEYENSVHRYSADLAKGDIVAFFADVDRINGDLKLFASLLDKDLEFITPDSYLSDITYDFFIYHLIKESGRYYFQIQPDFFYKFAPANIEATYYRADGIKLNKNFVELQIGENYQIESVATFSQNKDLKDFPLDRRLLTYSSKDPSIADINSDGVITAKNTGSTTIYVSYKYLDNVSLDTSMVVSVYSKPENETCDTAIDATNGLSIYASTIGAVDDYNPKKCIFSMFSGGDIVYFVDAEPGTEYEIIVTPYGNFDPMIYVTDDCSKPECLYGTVLNGPGEIEKLTFKNDTYSKKRYFIIIDGEAGDEGSFQLSITRK